MSAELLEVSPEMQQAYVEWEPPVPFDIAKPARVLGVIRAAFYAGWQAAAPSLAARVRVLEDALREVVEATRAYLPPDGIDAQECLNRIIGATDNSAINPIIQEIDRGHS